MESRTRYIVTYTICCALCSIAVGVIFFQGHVFVRTHYAFQFIANGIIGGIFYSFLRFANGRDALASLFALFVLQFLLTRPDDIWIVVRDIGFITALGSALYLFVVNYSKRGKGDGFRTPLVLSGLLGACNLLVSVVLVLLGTHSLLAYYPILVLNTLIGILSGAGIGAGILLAQKVIPFALPKSGQ
jgi:hypothetical protein